MKRFRELSERDKLRVYAFNYGNVMLIAEYLNEKYGEGLSYLDVIEDLDRESVEFLGKLREALMIRLDYVVKKNLGLGNSMYDLKVASKIHPDYKEEGRGGLRVDSISITNQYLSGVNEKLKRVGTKVKIDKLLKSEGGDAEKEA